MTVRLLAIFAAACFVVASENAAALEYPIQVNPTLNGLDIGIEPVIAGPLVIVKLTNKTNRAARCDLEFLNGPQFPYRRTTRIDAGKVESISFSPDVEVLSLTVNVSCVPDRA